MMDLGEISWICENSILGGANSSRYEFVLGGGLKIPRLPFLVLILICCFGLIKLCYQASLGVNLCALVVL